MNEHALRDDVAAAGPVFEARDVAFRYASGRDDAVAGVTVRVGRGEFVALIGPNGSGKSTLLRLLLGVLRPRAGTVLYRGRDVHAWPREQLAREVGVVAQAEEFAFPLSVRELVAMGRYPHLGGWRAERDADRDAVLRAMRRCEVDAFADRSVLELSGGERQRARLARALAQEPASLVLDEPTASLDIAHEMTLFELLAGFAADGGTVVVVTHHLNLAARYARRLVLLDRGTIAADGAPHEVLTRDTVSHVYQWPVVITAQHDADAAAPQVVPLRSQPQETP